MFAPEARRRKGAALPFPCPVLPEQVREPLRIGGAVQLRDEIVGTQLVEIPPPAPAPGVPDPVAAGDAPGT